MSLYDNKFMEYYNYIFTDLAGNYLDDIFVKFCPNIQQLAATTEKNNVISLVIILKNGGV